MGSVFGHQETKPIPDQDRWLQNQTFRVHKQTYTLLDRRGGGAFGSVWASRTPSGRYAAVKVFNLRRFKGTREINRLIKSFQDEVQMSYRMRDARNFVATIYGFDFDEHRTVGLMAMELGGDSLEVRAAYLNKMQAESGMPTYDYISPRDRKSIWIQLVNIILALDRHGVIHRDLKPANLVFFGPLLKVVDLGIAQKELLRYGEPQHFMGTVGYSAPECIQRGPPITTKADIWSAGAILYHLTYGGPPDFGTEQPPPGFPATRSPFVRDVLRKCLQWHPNQRIEQQLLAFHPLTNNPTAF